MNGHLEGSPSCHLRNCWGIGRTVQDCIALVCELLGWALAGLLQFVVLLCQRWYALEMVVPWLIMTLAHVLGGLGKTELVTFDP